jgi:hypothetical protein
MNTLLLAFYILVFGMNYYSKANFYESNGSVSAQGGGRLGDGETER